MGRKAFIAAVLLLLTLPMILMPFRADVVSHQARTVSTSVGLDAMEEKLALRTALITLRGQALSLVGESGSGQVIQGSGMLFYHEEMPDYLGTSALTAEDISALTDMLAALSAELAAEGRGLLILVAPNKSSIYPERVPARYLPAKEPSNLLRLQEALAEQGLNVLDARSLLLSSKDQGQLYYANDTHWNARGAWIVCQALMEQLDAPVPYGEISFSPGQAGDLIVMAQPGASPVEEDAIPNITRVYRTARPMRSLNDMRIETAAPCDTQPILVVRDSFGEGLFPYLANSMGRMVYSRVYADVAQQARQAEAETVVLEIAERSIPAMLSLGIH